MKAEKFCAVASNKHAELKTAAACSAIPKAGMYNVSKFLLKIFHCVKKLVKLIFIVVPAQEIFLRIVKIF